MEKRWWFWLLVIFLLLLFLLLLFLSVRFVSQRTSFFGRAFGPSDSEGSLVLENCYLFASPLQARADGQEKIRVTIFALSNQGKGISGEAVFLGEDNRLELTAVQSVTDELGRALFDLSSTVVGEYLIEARVGNQVLPQKVRVSFR